MWREGSEVTAGQQDGDDRAGVDDDAHPVASMADARTADRGNDVGHRVAPGRPAPLWWQGVVRLTKDPIQIGLIDDVLRADLPGGEATGANPAAHGLLIASDALRRLRNGQHGRRILQHRFGLGEKGEAPRCASAR